MTIFRISFATSYIIEEKEEAAAAAAARVCLSFEFQNRHLNLRTSLTTTNLIHIILISRADKNWTQLKKKLQSFSEFLLQLHTLLRRRIESV